MMSNSVNTEKQSISRQTPAFNKSARKAFVRGGARRGVNPESLVPVGFEPWDNEPFSPLIVTPKSESVDLIQWLSSNLEQIEKQLYQQGAILFRGFKLGTVDKVSRFSDVVMSSVFTENTEHQPVSIKGDVQIPVEYAKDRFLLWHNENTFNLNWPMRAIFACAQPATQGGETPIVDSRAIYNQLDKDIRQAFIDKQVMYVRKYGPGDHVGLGWKTIFKTDDKKQAEQACLEQGMSFEWLPGEHLLTKAVRPAVIQHPVTGDWSWFNQAQHWHFSCLPEQTQEAFRKIFDDEKDYPRNCYFGDGSKIPDSTMNNILDLYRENHVEFPWQQGDLLLVDNILKAHARNAFEGERKILVCFGDMGSF